jgi:hypothetical protein
MGFCNPRRCVGGACKRQSACATGSQTLRANSRPTKPNPKVLGLGENRPAQAPKQTTRRELVPASGYGRLRRLGAWISAATMRRVVSFPFFSMGQYFKAVNLDKREVVCPWCLGGGAKLWEWAANPYGAVFTLLLRKSSATGGGDYHDPLPPHARRVKLDAKDARQAVIAAIAQCVAAEGRPAAINPDSVVGRWAGDRVVLLGDYDDSKLWDELPRYRNISKELAETWNEFIELEEKQLSCDSECSH